jgi:hypothetical protein
MCDQCDKLEEKSTIVYHQRKPDTAAADSALYDET